jgi:ribosomal protein S30
MTECRNKFDSLMSDDAARKTVLKATLLLAEAASQLTADLESEPVDWSRRIASKTRISAADATRSASKHETSRLRRNSRTRQEELLDAFVETLKRDKVCAMEFILTVERAMEARAAWPQGRGRPTDRVRRPHHAAAPPAGQVMSQAPRLPKNAHPLTREIRFWEREVVKAQRRLIALVRNGFQH